MAGGWPRPASQKLPHNPGRGRAEAVVLPHAQMEALQQRAGMRSGKEMFPGPLLFSHLHRNTENGEEERPILAVCCAFPPRGVLTKVL